MMTISSLSPASSSLPAAPQAPTDSTSMQNQPPAVVPILQENKIVSDNTVDITLKNVLLPPSAKDGKVPETPSILEIETGDGADDIHISRGPGGQLNALINGKSYLLPVDNKRDTLVVIKTHKGDDNVRIDPDVVVKVKIEGGEGNDYIQTGGGTSHVYGGAGDDTIKLGSATSYAEGNDGDDTMIGGTGNHAMYGGNGKDRMYGGYGPDSKTSYMDGGNDDDLMYGGSGHNILHGGQGNDQIVGYGRSTIYTGRGHDSVYSNSRDDIVYAKRSDNLQLPFGFKFIETVPLPSDAGTKALKIEGTPEFKQRVEDDLELYRSSPVGQSMLKELDSAAENNGAKITIKQSGSTGYSTNDIIPKGTLPSEWRNPRFIQEGSRGTGQKEASILYDPAETKESLDRSPILLPPVIGLYHEMAHAYNGATGSMLPDTTEVKHPDGTSSEEDNYERQAVGVPTNSPPFDFDNDPSTPPTTLNPYSLTENGIREEMSLPLRTSYADA